MLQRDFPERGRAEVPPRRIGVCFGTSRNPQALFTTPEGLNKPAQGQRNATLGIDVRITIITLNGLHRMARPTLQTLLVTIGPYVTLSGYNHCVYP
jgi:hypothetical protein